MVKGEGEKNKKQGVIRGFLVRRQMKHQWEIVESQRKYIASFLSDIQLKGETLMQFQHALNDHDEARNVEQMFLDVAESEESRMSTIPNVPPPPPLTNGVYKSESAADSAYDTSQPPSPGKISTSTAEDDVFHEGGNGASSIPPPPLPFANSNMARKEEEDELADCGYVSMKDAPPALKHSLKLDNNENEMKVEKKVASKKVEPSEDVTDLLPPPPPPMDHPEMSSCPNQDVEFPPPPPMAEIAGDTKENIAAIRARFKQQEDKPKEEPLRATSPPRKKIISLAPVIAEGAKSESRPEVASPSKSRIAERIAQLKEQEVMSERESAGPAGVVVVRESEYANMPGNEQTVKRRPPAPVRDPNTRLTMIENTSVQRMSYGNGVDVRMVRTRSEEYRIQSQYGGMLYDDTVVGSTYYDNVGYRNSMEHTYGVIPDVPPPPVQAPPPPPQMSHLPHQGVMRPMSVAAVPPPPAHAPPPVPSPMPSGNTNNTNNIFMQIPGATSRPRSEMLYPGDVPPPPCVAPPPPPQPPPVPSGPKPAHLMSIPVTSSFAPPPPPAVTGFTPPPPPPPSMGGGRPQHIPAPPPMGAMVPPPPPAPNAPPPPPPPAGNKPTSVGGGGGLLDGISAVQLKTVSKEKKKSLSTEAPMDNLMAELQNFSGRLRPTPKQSKPPSPEIKDETDSGVNQFQLKPTKTNGTRSDTPSPPQPPSPPQHQNGNNSTQSNAYRLSPNSNGGPPTTPKSPKPTPNVMPKPGKARNDIPASPTAAPPAPPNAPSAPQKAFTPPSPPQKAPVAPPMAQKGSPPQTSPKRIDYSKRISMPPETRPLSPTSMSAVAERTRKVSAPGPSAPLTMQLPEGYDNMPAWKKAMVDKKLKEAMAKEEEERRKQEEELAKWQGVPEWKRKLMMEKEKKKVEEAEATIDKTQTEREAKLRSMPTWKRNIVKKKLGSDGEDSGSPAKGGSSFEETSTAL